MAEGQLTGDRRERNAPKRKGVRSSSLFRRAKAVMPGGVSSPVRSFASVGGEPFFVAAGRGARIRDADGKSYVDFVMSYGPHLFGHGPAFVRRALSRACRRGTSYGAPTELEVRLAAVMVASVPELTNRTISIDGTAFTTRSARRTSSSVGAP